MATTNNEKTTIYLNPYVKKYIQHKAVEEDTSVSEIINTAFANKVAGLRDKSQLARRRKEPTISFDNLLEDLGLTYDDLRD